MSFKEINLGFKEFFYRTSQYHSYLYNGYDETKQKSRVGFFVVNGTSNFYVRRNWTSYKEIYAKCDFYWTAGKSVYLQFGHQYAYVKLELYSSSADVGYYVTHPAKTIASASSTTLEQDTGLRLNALNTIWLHIKWGSAGTGYIEFKLNQKYFGKYQDNAVSGSSGEKFYIWANNQSGYNYCDNFPFSSIIISDEYISPTEKIVQLPISNTVTDMEARESGLYIANAASETLLQSVNVNSLIEQYGSDTNVTGIALIGNPAYEVEDVIGSLTALTKENDVVTEHDKISLSTDTDSMIVSSFSMASSTTIADLSNMQFGWRAEE